MANFPHILFIIFFHIIFILLTFKVKTDLVLAAANETDQNALLSIKNLIKEDPFSVLSSWNHSFHFCRWRGVTCSRQHQRVTALDLSALDLVGSLSPQIGNLTLLRTINLSNNSFNGAIPQEIGHLNRLRYLLLQNNYFEGNFPFNLSRCLDIKVLNIYGNYLGGSIPTDIGSFSNLTELVLGPNNFTGLIPPSLGNLSSLRTLALNSNNLTGNIPWTISSLSNLVYFNLGDNHLSGILPSSLYNISSIQVFGVHFNHLEGKLPQDLGLKLPNLSLFLIESNKFSGSIPPSIANASGLAQIIVGDNNFVGSLSINFGSFRNLQRLGLYGNQFGSSAPLNYVSFLVKSLINCTNLEYLDIELNGFTGEFPYSIVNLSTTLFWINLGGNYLSGSIPHEIGNLVNLVRLIMFRTLLIGSIPESIGKLSKLEALLLSSNKISGEIPTSIGNISQLTVLSLGKNILEGSIPLLGNLTNLLILNLESNRFTGAIPEQIFGVHSNIHSVYLNQNQLTGALPLNMGNPNNLIDLVISGNRLTGEIPSTLGNFLMLESLYLDDNHFEGTIPTSFRQLKSITFLDLSENNLSGMIPSFLEDLSLIQQLNLSNNMFKGKVPTKGVFNNISMFSVVGNMQLCGGIQALQLPKCDTEDPRKRRKSFPHRIIPLVIILPIVFLLVCPVMIFFRLRRSIKQNLVVSPLEDQHPKLSYGELLKATNGFSIMNLIGQGRYGSVYKGFLSSSQQIVAVKVINVEIRGGSTSFLTECEIFRNIRHRNLVKIITSCSSIDYEGSEFKALVLEFMPQGSLDNWLHPSPSEQENDKELTLLQRLSIAIDVALAVEYIHHHCETRIVHCDLKPSNIFMDEELNAHVGDFGLARFVLDTTSSSNSSETSSIGIRGTTGYIPPEYGMGVEVSPQGDVYSYGILLLEMITGKRPTNIMFTDNLSLRNYVSTALSQNVMENFDPQITMEFEDGSTTSQYNITNSISNMEVCLTSILKIGILCCSERPIERMNIRDVVVELTAIRNVLLRVTRQRG